MPEDTVDDLISQLNNLRIQETDVIRRLVEARARESPESQRGRREEYRIGDRIEITNRVNTRPGRTATISDRTATVTKVTAKRVYFRTDSDQTTWRAPANLKHIE